MTRVYRLTEFGIREIFAGGIRNPVLWNPEYSLRNPNPWNPESKFHWPRIRNPVPGVRSPWHGIQNAKWPSIPLCGEKCIYNVYIMDIYTQRRRINFRIKKNNN